MMMVPMMVMMTMPAMVTMPPSHRGRLRLDILLHGRSSTGIAERQRIRPFRRRGENEHCADGGKPQNFRHLHMKSPWSSDDRVRSGGSRQKAASPRRSSQIEADDVNAI
jgi:hypothetical protein